MAWKSQSTQFDVGREGGCDHFLGLDWMWVILERWVVLHVVELDAGDKGREDACIGCFSGGVVTTWDLMWGKR